MLTGISKQQYSTTTRAVSYQEKDLLPEILQGVDFLYLCNKYIQSLANQQIVNTKVAFMKFRQLPSVMMLKKFDGNVMGINPYYDQSNEINCFTGNFFNHFMRTCAIYKYIILICDLCTVKFSLKMDLYKKSLRILRRLKKAQGSGKF